MLGKLLKYEFKATSRMLIPLYATVLAFAVINKIFLADIFSSTSGDSIFGLVKILSLIGYVLMLIASGIGTAIIIIQRFYKNMLKEEGYLMNTLPVSTATNLLSKLIAAVTWQMVSTFVIFLSIIILIPSDNTLGYLSSFGRAIGYYTNIDLNDFMVNGVLLGIISTVEKILTFYAAMCIGHLAKEKKILCSFGAFIGMKFIRGIITGVINIATAATTYKLGNASSALGVFNTMTSISTIISLLIVGVLFFVCNTILKEKLNLE